ncbi:MAG: hypothetical protein C0611_10560, partial [Desulfobacteraceae bacterium]
VIAFQQTEKITWKCIVGNLKKWKDQDLIKTISVNNQEIELVKRLNFFFIFFLHLSLERMGMMPMVII